MKRSRTEPVKDDTLDEEHEAAVLIVDDDPTTLFTMGNGLKGLDARVFKAESGQEGLALMLRHEFAVVILDVRMPGMGGLETAELMHGNETTRYVPIIFVTGVSIDESSIFEGYETGAVDYLIKPINLEILKSKVNVFLKLYRQEKALDLMDEMKREVAERRRAEKGLNTALKMLERANQDLERQKIEIRNSHTRFQSMISSTADGIVVVDSNRRTLYVNPAAEEILETRSDLFVGEKFDHPIVPGEVAEYSVDHAHGEKTTVEMRAVETEWDGKPAYLASLRDVTDRVRALTELEEMRNRDLELKDQFLSHVSHELRSPLAVVHQFATILIDGIAGDINARQREYLEISLNNINQLTAMIANLVDVTRVGVGKTLVRPEILELGELIAETVSTFHAGAETKGIEIHSRVEESLPAAFADSQRVRQIIVNLVENALKYTAKGGSISVEAKVSGDEPEFLVVTVSDTGAGISENELEKIFRYLYQADTSVVASRKGLGLGLYICRELLTRHGGKIWAKSKVGEGTTMFFTLPMFSLRNQLKTILMPEGLRKKDVVVTIVEVSCESGRALTNADESGLQCVCEAITSCVMPNLDVLLPRMSRAKYSERSYIITRAYKNRAVVMAKRVQAQLGGSGKLADSQLLWEISSQVASVPHLDDDSFEEVLKIVESKVREIIASSALRKEVPA